MNINDNIHDPLKIASRRLSQKCFRILENGETCVQSIREGPKFG